MSVVNSVENVNVLLNCWGVFSLAYVFLSLGRKMVIGVFHCLKMKKHRVCIKHTES